MTNKNPKTSTVVGKFITKNILPFLTVVFAIGAISSLSDDDLSPTAYCGWYIVSVIYTIYASVLIIRKVFFKKDE